MGQLIFKERHVQALPRPCARTAAAKEHGRTHLNLTGLLHGLPLDPGGRVGAAGDRGTAAKSLELGVNNLAVVNLDLELHDIAAGRGADQAGADRQIALVQRTGVPGVVVCGLEWVGPGRTRRGVAGNQGNCACACACGNVWLSINGIAGSKGMPQ